MAQKSLRMPLVVTGIGLQEQVEHNVSETESTTNFTEKHGEQFISLFWHFGIFVVRSIKNRLTYSFTLLNNRPLY